jgi:putative NADH-flavin reductase
MNAPGTRILVAELLDSQRERVSELFDQTLNVIEDAFQARKIFVVRGVLVDGGARSLRQDRGGEVVYSAAFFTQITQVAATAANELRCVRAANAGGGEDRGARRALRHARGPIT